MPNATSTPESPTLLEVRRRFAAPRDRVFAAWASADALKRWHAPADAEVVDASVDFRVGGSYYVRMRGTNGTLYLVSGRYREIDWPARLVLTWQWETPLDASESLVTVQFLERGEETEIVITHANLTTEQSRDGHRHGWVACLEKLAAAI